jgi:Domain of unknown function (DUF4383)
MDTTSPARLYASLIGAVLVIAGIIGFFYSASFSTGSAEVAADSDEVFGILAVNGWHNVVHIVIGLIGLAAAGTIASARAYALAFGVIYLALAIWGFAESDNILIGLLPTNDEDNVLHLILGLLGLGAYAATPAEEVPPATTTPSAP